MENKERNLALEMDKLKDELAQIKVLLTQNLGDTIKEALAEKGVDPEPTGERVGRIHKMKMHPDKNVDAIMDRLQVDCGITGDSGRISYMGVFSSGDRQSNWVRHNVNTDILFELAESGKAAQVLSSIGSNDRLKLLLTLLKKPMTVAQLVEQAGFTSTGQVYHHLKALQAADLIVEEKGRYSVRHHRVQGIIMLLAGVSDMVDEAYTRGDWSEA